MVYKELQDTYKYPIKLLEIEYPVNSFSKTGAVDIAVCIYGKNGTRVRFIFISKGVWYDIEKRVKQLKSYMSNEKLVVMG